MKTKKSKPSKKIQVVSKATIETAERQREALILRKSAMDYDQIAEKMGIPKARVAGLIRKAILDIPKEEAAEMRAIEGERLDEMHD